MDIYEFSKGDYIISSDKKLLDFGVIHSYLGQRSYWSENIPLETVRTAAENSLAFGIYHRDQQIGYARVISDMATFGYLADVFVLEEHRNQGLSKWLIESIMSIPGLQGLRRWLLVTQDAHGLYSQYGFTPLQFPDRFMEIARPDIYKQN